jgi:hypothetical protein
MENISSALFGAWFSSTKVFFVFSYAVFFIDHSLAETADSPFRSNLRISEKGAKVLFQKGRKGFVPTRGAKGRTQ